ncbi:MAG: 16S rRNA (guanine(966)-N(2))-methyltransferase RsmD [Pseudohongiellaceae bacterium]
MSQVRIIAGKWRGRKISFPDQKGLRPSADRIRETLFNWLQSNIVGTRCLDLFAGSGALSIEAASRGARQVTCIELNQEPAASIKKNITLLKTNAISLIQHDAIKFLKTAKPEIKYDLVFLDPPFIENLLEKSCQLLENNSWLSDSALIYMESNQAIENYDLPLSWALIKQKKAGLVYYGLCKRFKYKNK